MLSRIPLALALAVSLVACRGVGRVPPRSDRISSEAKTLTSPPAAAKSALVGKTIAILATDGVEQVELVKPQKMFADEGAKTLVVAPKAGTIQAMNHDEKGDKITVDLALDVASPDGFDALVLPGGVANPDKL